jgi:methylenetetrahydrofolate--tRNA-(uracil-5-)-methyltransferase
MRRLGSLLMEVAGAVRVPAGNALAVDRDAFAREVTRRVEEEPAIEVVREEATAVPEGPAVIATGPLTSDALAAALRSLTGEDGLFFYDAISPIVESGSIDRERVYLKSRYDKGEASYLNCPMDRDGYVAFRNELVEGARVSLREFEKERFFEACLPVEELARRGEDTLRFGPMRPVGLEDPGTGRRPYAVVQLRQDDLAAENWGLVGFQTNLTYPEQERIFRTIPGLESARFVRLGSIHRNTYLNSPRLLLPSWQLRARGELLVAGQLSGVEGYSDSSASGILAGINALRLLRGEEPAVPPRETALGALSHYVSHASPGEFQPMNVNFGLLPPLDRRVRGRRRRREEAVGRALAALDRWLEETGLSPGWTGDLPPAAPAG